MYVPRLNRRVIVLTRDEKNSATDMGITEVLGNAKPVYAAIVPVDAIEFTNSVNNGYEYTHKIYVRYLDYLSTNHVIVHSSVLPSGAKRTDLYKILRYSLVDGVYFYTELECVLEKPSWNDGTVEEDQDEIDNATSFSDASFNDGTSLEDAIVFDDGTTLLEDPIELDYGTTVLDPRTSSDG